MEVRALLHLWAIGGVFVYFCEFYRNRTVGEKSEGKACKTSLGDGDGQTPHGAQLLSPQPTS